MSQTTNPVELLNNLDANAIEARLDELSRERHALMVLLRAARTRQRRDTKRSAGNTREGVQYAA